MGGGGMAELLLVDSPLLLRKQDGELQHMNTELLDHGGSVPPEALMTTRAVVPGEG